MSKWLRLENAIQRAYKKLNNQVSISTLSAGTANRYGDMKGNTWSIPTPFFAQLLADPLESQTDDIGWHKNLGSVKVSVPVVELQRVALADSAGKPLFKIGDRLTVAGVTYEIREIDTYQTVFDNLNLFVNIFGMRGVS